MLYTLLILIIYQFAAHVTVPGVDRSALDDLFSSDEAGFLSVLNLLSGGAVQNFSVIANGVYPYITASIILQLLYRSSLAGSHQKNRGQDKSTATPISRHPMAACSHADQHLPEPVDQW
jgi:preprotein translocase subunit SecY